MDTTRRAHKTHTEYYIDVTRASRPVKAEDQIFKAYDQPQYKVFTYQSFILEDNSHDGALLDGIFVQRDNPGTKHAQHLSSVVPMFCIRDVASVEELAQFLGVKHDRSPDNLLVSSINYEVLPYCIQVLKKMIDCLSEALYTNIYEDTLTIPWLEFMRQLLKRSVVHFQNACHALLVESSD